MTLTADQLMLLINSLMMPFIRLSAFFMVAPIYGARTVPVRIRVFLALIIALILSPSMPVNRIIQPLSAEGLLLIAQQVTVGIAMGMVMQFMMSAVMMAGHTMATAMGLGFASSADPQNGIPITIVSQLYLVLATLFFLAMDGHLLLLQMLASSFTSFPLDVFTLTPGFFMDVVEFSARLFVIGTVLALPVMTGVLLVNLAFGVMTRAAPQLNIFSMGFPITILAGFCLMVLTLPVISPLLSNGFTESFVFLSNLVEPGR